jgi:hypothetical protein
MQTTKLMRIALKIGGVVIFCIGLLPCLRIITGTAPAALDAAPWWIQALVLAFWALFALCGLIAIRESDLEFESEKEDRQ